MLTSISRARRTKSPDLVGLLLECHDRIRYFIRLARDAGARSEVSDQETIDACLQVERYMTEALPLHVADEEQSVLPHLHACCSTALADALETMERQHLGHTPKIEALLQASAQVRGAPHDQARRAALAAAALDLENELFLHLALEETIIFPAIREQMTIEVQERLINEVRLRRAHPATTT